MDWFQKLLAAACLAALAVASTGRGLALAAAPDKGTEIDALISQLGAIEFSAREAASEELTRIGLPAMRSLEAAVQSPDREVRYRAERLLGVIRESDLQRRLDAFLRGEEGDEDYPLPGWSLFAKEYGDGIESRTSFVSMQKADAELLATLDRSPKEAAALLSARALSRQQALQQSDQPPQLSLGQILTLLFVAARPEVNAPTPLPPQTTALVFSFCNQPAMREAMASSTKGILPRKLLANLITHADEASATQAMMIAYQYSMPEGLAPAVKMLDNPARRVSHMAHYALLVVAKLGNESHLPTVEKLFDDKSVISRMQENNAVYEVQLRDAALAAAVYLTKRDLKTYFPAADKQPVTDPQQLFFNARLLNFANDAQREAAFKLWAKTSAEKKADK